MTPGRILVVDDDPWIQRSVASALGQRGYQVSLAGDPTGAFAVAAKVQPDVILTSASLPALGGWAWWERLRALPACADTPIVFLLSVLDPTTTVHGAGPRDQQLRKPFRVEDLERSVVTALGKTPVDSPAPDRPPPARGKRAVDPTKPSAGFRPLSALTGVLDQISLSSVLVLLEMERKTGILLVERENGSARLFLSRGRVIRADCDRPARSGTAAVYDLLTWTAGMFDFLAGDVGGVDDIQTSTTFLLLEGARRIDEANEKQRSSTDNKL